MNNIAFCYIPVLHKGYLKFLENISQTANTLYLIGEEILAKFTDLDYIFRKDSIRAMSSATTKKLIDSLGLFSKVDILTLDNTAYFAKSGNIYAAPAEDISQMVAQKYLQNKEVSLIPIFLRWNKNNVETPVQISADKTVQLSKLDKEMMFLANIAGGKSWDWWRQVGAVIFLPNNASEMIAHNSHLPHEQMPNAFGDPRSIFKKGLHIELSTADHAEAMLIAEAAKRGVSLEGSSLYVTDFPCPPCAKLIARSGIKKCFFIKGYGMLDGEEILKNAGVEIIRVVE